MVRTVFSAVLGGAVLAGALLAAPMAPAARAADVIAFSVSGTTNPFYAAMARGVRDEAKVLGYDALVLDAQNNIAKQISDVEDALTKNVKALLINGVDDGAIRLAKMALAKGIPVMALQRDLGAGNVVLGEQLVHWYAKTLGGRESKILILTGTPGAASAEDRTKGINATLPKYPNIKVLAVQTGFYDRAKSVGVAENLLQRHPDAEAILCQNDEMAIGALAAARAQNRSVKITGMDANPDAVKAVEAGQLYMTIALPPYDIGRVGVQFAQKKLTGQAVPERHIMDVTFLTKDNVASFKR